MKRRNDSAAASAAAAGKMTVARWNEAVYKYIAQRPADIDGRLEDRPNGPPKQYK